MSIQLKVEITASNRARLNHYKLKSFLNAQGYNLYFRMDEFTEQKNSAYTFYGLEVTRLEHLSLDEIEAFLEHHLKGIGDETKAKQIEYPVVVGTVPYEQASEFMKINFEPYEKGTCFLSQIVLAVHKSEPYGYFIKHMTENITFEDIKQLKQYKSNFFSLLEKFALEPLIKPLIKLLIKPLIEPLVEPLVEPLIKTNENNCSGDLTPSRVSPIRVLNFDKVHYTSQFNTCLEYVNEGEAFQIVLSKPLRLPFKKSAYDYYLQSHLIQKSAYSCYLDIGQGLSITSPEMLVSYNQTHVYTKPIAGTRSIQRDGRDEERIYELVHDTKEAAEHLMLVDLGRNDLSKVCKAGTISVLDYKKPLILEHVVHLVSEVTGERDFSRFFDPIRATFPAGTVTGAPKLRAMEIISELEQCKRGLYGGAVYEYTSHQNFSSCIAIRGATFEDEEMIIQVGSGIVFDSTMGDEYKELINKAKGNFKTYEQMEGENVSFN